MADVNDGLAAGTSEAVAIADMTPDEARAELAKREAQKLTRRAALAKMGVRGAMAIFAAFSVDDLARMVAKKMEQRAGENAAIDEVARQLHNAGVSFAAASKQTTAQYCVSRATDPNGNYDQSTCKNCCINHKTALQGQCDVQYPGCAGSISPFCIGYYQCTGEVASDFNQCQLAC